MTQTQIQRVGLDPFISFAFASLLAQCKTWCKRTCKYERTVMQIHWFHYYSCKSTLMQMSRVNKLSHSPSVGVSVTCIICRRGEPRVERGFCARHDECRTIPAPTAAEIIRVRIPRRSLTYASDLVTLSHLFSEPISMIKKVYQDICWREHESSRKLDNILLNPTSLVPPFVRIVARTPKCDVSVWCICLVDIEQEAEGDGVGQQLLVGSGLPPGGASSAQCAAVLHCRALRRNLVRRAEVTYQWCQRAGKPKAMSSFLCSSDVMECSHWPTPTPTKWVCNPFAFVWVLVSVSASLNSSAYYNWTHYLSVSASVSASVNTQLEGGKTKSNVISGVVVVVRKHKKLFPVDAELIRMLFRALFRPTVRITLCAFEMSQIW